MIRTAATSATGRQVRCSASRRQSRARRSAAPTIWSDGTTSGVLPAAGHGRQFGIEAAGEGRDGVGAGQAGIAQGEIARMNPGVSVGQPPGCLPIGDAGTQALGNRRRRGGRGCLQPGHGVRGVGERHEEGMGIGVAGRRPARGGGREVGRIVVRVARHEGG